MFEAPNHLIILHNLISRQLSLSLSLWFILQFIFPQFLNFYPNIAKSNQIYSITLAIETSMGIHYLQMNSEKKHLIIKILNQRNCSLSEIVCTNHIQLL